MHLTRDVMDKQVVDRDDHKIGKVDDVVFELSEGNYLLVRGILIGHGALARNLGKRAARFTSWVRAFLLGSPMDTPMEIGWDRVMTIDVVVRVDVDREEDGLMETQKTIWERWISRIPFAVR